MDRNELLRLAADKAQESLKGGKMNGKTWVGIAVVAGVVLVGFIAYRLLLIELITRLR
ncbi:MULTISPECIES: hypothetical protein [Nonomuraea]|uniref:hypothetical protein n=1 Tax=Nonomuraea TaxID=83681 RepID=UPI001CD976E1|nr:hypothetical protein [Nonomuraea aurantiaca]MCA2220370.1 hypothetical protein [Nonomuraea aurantiaca]